MILSNLLADCKVKGKVKQEFINMSPCLWRILVNCNSSSHSFDYHIPKKKRERKNRPAMKLRIAVIFGLVCMIAICSARPAGNDDYAEYEDAEPAPPPKPAPRSNPLLNRRNPLSRNSPAKSTTTTPPPPLEEEEVAEEEEEIVEDVPVEPSSTTEPPRKLKGGILRPFRSNDDLLAALKRRREQAAATKPGSSKNIPPPESNDSEPPVEPAPKPTKSASGRRRFNSKTDVNNNADSEVATSAPARAGRRFKS